MKLLFVSKRRVMIHLLSKTHVVTKILFPQHFHMGHKKQYNLVGKEFDTNLRCEGLSIQTFPLIFEKAKTICIMLNYDS